MPRGFAQSWDNTEEFIEDKFPVDIRRNPCNWIARSSRTDSREFFPPRYVGQEDSVDDQKSLRFEITDVSAAKPYDIYWKVLNRGDVARRRNCIRGQIIKDDGLMQRTETTSFLGDHIVECYCVKDGVVVARTGFTFLLMGSRTMTTDHINVLEGQLRRVLRASCLPHKTHEKCADILLERQGT